MPDLFFPFSCTIAYGSVAMKEADRSAASQLIESRFSPGGDEGKETDQARFYTLHRDQAFRQTFDALGEALRCLLYGPLRFSASTTKFYFGRSWPVIRDRAGGQMHFHSGSVFSGVYYLSVPEGSGGIEFLKPYRFLADAIFREGDADGGNMFGLTVTSDHFVLFNSELLHRGQNGTSSQRENLVGIAFDLFTSTDPRNVTGGMPHFHLVREI